MTGKLARLLRHDKLTITWHKIRHSFFSKEQKIRIHIFFPMLFPFYCISHDWNVTTMVIKQNK